MFDVQKYIHESNLIEGIKNPKEDNQSLIAWTYLVDKRTITIPILLEVHRLITVNQLTRKEAGHFRNFDVMIGGRICPEPFIAEQLIHNWVKDFVEHWKTLDPIEMHVRFEKAHPWMDGNGRSGRMLLWFHEHKLEKTPTLFLNKEKREVYYPLFD